MDYFLYVLGIILSLWWVIVYIVEPILAYAVHPFWMSKENMNQYRKETYRWYINGVGERRKTVPFVEWSGYIKMWLFMVIGVVIIIATYYMWE